MPRSKPEIALTTDIGPFVPADTDPKSATPIKWTDTTLSGFIAREVSEVRQENPSGGQSSPGFHAFLQSHLDERGRRLHQVPPRTKLNPAQTEAIERSLLDFFSGIPPAFFKAESLAASPDAPFKDKWGIFVLHRWWQVADLKHNNHSGGANTRVEFLELFLRFLMYHEFYHFRCDRQRTSYAKLNLKPAPFDPSIEEPAAQHYAWNAVVAHCQFKKHPYLDASIAGLHASESSCPAPYNLCAQPPPTTPADSAKAHREFDGKVIDNLLGNSSLAQAGSRTLLAPFLSLGIEPAAAPWFYLHLDLETLRENYVRSLADSDFDALVSDALNNRLP